jgi:hypothetical protein
VAAEAGMTRMVRACGWPHWLWPLPRRGHGGVPPVLQLVLQKSMNTALACMAQSTKIEGVGVSVHYIESHEWWYHRVILWRNHRAVCRRSCLSYSGADLV